MVWHSVMVSQFHGIIVSWYHGIMVVIEESRAGAIRFGMPPPIDGIRPNGQNLARNILTSFIIIIIIIMVSWHHHSGIMASSWNRGIM